MQKLIELYAMVSLNDSILRGSERTAILDARRALRSFQRAMEKYKAAANEVESTEEHTFDMAA